MNIFFQRCWIFLKKNWQYILAVLGAIFTFFLLRREKITLLDQLREIQEAHDKELKEIEAAREEERKKNKQAYELLQKRLNEIQSLYDEAKLQLEKKKKKQIEDLMKKYADDPTELAKKLSAVTGFEVILPE